MLIQTQHIPSVERMITDLNSYAKEIDKLKFLAKQPSQITKEIARVLGCSIETETLLDEITEIKNSWGTDPVVFNAMDKEFNFTLDGAASDENHKCGWYFTKQDSALDQNWSEVLEAEGDTRKAVWINPPYGAGFIKMFMQKCAEQKQLGVTSVLLVPATLDAQWLPLDDISEIRVVTGGRLSFYHPITSRKISGNTKGSMFVIFRPGETEIKLTLVDREKLYSSGNT